MLLQVPPLLVEGHDPVPYCGALMDAHVGDAQVSDDQVPELHDSVVEPESTL